MPSHADGDADLDLDRMIRGLRAGDGAAMTRFVDAYRPALERLAARRIDPALRRRFGPDSVAQSVCRTFLRRVRGGEFELADGDRLWALLCAIALTKVRDRARFHMRERRSLAREERVDAAAAARGTADAAADPAAAAAFADALEQALGDCGEEERRLVALRLEDRSVAEIAAELGCSRRTVFRLLRRAEETLTARLGP